MNITFETVILDIKEHDIHEWIIETSLVAEGYGVTPDAIRRHKSTKPAELIEGKHFISVTNPHANPRMGIPHVQTFWTKRGVVRLGFFIESDRAKRFRDWAEDLIVAGRDRLPDFSNPVIAARSWADQLEARLLAEARVEALAQQNQKMQAKSDFVDRIIDNDDKIDIGQAAKVLKLSFGRNTLFQKLREKGVFFKSKNEPKQEYIDRGYFELKEKFIERNSHPGFMVMKVLVTQKGLAYIHKLFPSEVPQSKAMSIQ